MTISNFNIIIVNDFAHINGGAAKVALMSAIALAERGYSITVFTSVPPIMGNPCSGNHRFICLNQHETIKDPSRVRASIQGIWNVKAMRQMSSLLNTLDKKNTVIHLHGWTKALSSSSIHTAIRKKFKVICTIHDYFLACPNGGFYNYKQNRICALSPLSFQCIRTDCDVRNYSHKLWRTLRHGVQKKISHMPNRIEHFITLSNFSRELILPYLPIKAKVYHADNPVDAFTQDSPVNVADNKVFVAIGRISKEKGLHLFAEAAQRLSLDAVIVGDGPCSAELQARFPLVKYLGWQQPDKVRQILANARCLVFPSLWYETFGLVVKEAAAMGVSAIVADTSAARDLVEDGVTGLWFKGGNVTDLISKMRTLNENMELASRLGSTAYHYYWRKPLTLAHHAEQLLDIYSQVLAE